MFAWHDIASGLTDRDAAAARLAINNLRSELERQVVDHGAKLTDAENRHSAAIDELAALRREDRETLERYRVSIGEDIEEQRTKWQSQWDEIYLAFTERLRIESAVKLWRDRSEANCAGAVRGRSWAIGVGLAGLILAGGVAWTAFDFAHWLFSTAIVKAVGATKTGLRPTFHFELLFAAASTMLYLTMFLWTMRILVRVYMTEHHLAIDAESRASMAQTYLALIKEGAATDDDRKIVLASLFRPVVDGIVKDDAMPAITPAALLSGIIGDRA